MNAPHVRPSFRWEDPLLFDEQLSDEEKQMCGISDDMLRLSVGIEDIEDILWDLDQALQRAAGKA